MSVGGFPQGSRLKVEDPCVTALFQGGDTWVFFFARAAARVTVMPAMEIRIAIRIFDGREQKHLSHILALAGKRAEVDVLSVPAAEADVIFIRRDEPGASVFLQPGRADTRPLAVVYDELREGATWFLQKPATSAELIPLLRELEQKVRTLPARSAAASQHRVGPDPGAARGVAVAPAGNPRTGATASASRSETLAPLAPTRNGQALLEHLRACAVRGTVYAVELDPRHVLVLDGRRKLVHLPADFRQSVQQLMDLLVLFSADDFQLLTDDAASDLLESHPSRTAPLEQFTWAAGHHIEPQLPLPDSLSAISFRLKRWPSFTRLRYKPVHMQWAGRLIKTAHSLGNLIHDPMADSLDAIRFYNACVAGGLAVIEGAAPAVAPAPATGDGRQGVFQRILRKWMK